MPSKLLVLVMTILIAGATMSVSSTPAQAFGEPPFIKMFNANVGVALEAIRRFDAVPTRRMLVRAAREIARAETRIIRWLRARPATACQRPYVKQMISRGGEARRAWKASARAVNNGRYRLALRMVQRGAKFHVGMVNMGNRMVATCP